MTTQEEKLNGNKFKNAFKRLIYLPNGEFSLTRIMMAITFISAIALIWIGVILGINGVSLPDNIYTYVAGLTGGGIVQYGLTKYTNVKKEENKKK